MSLSRADNERIRELAPTHCYSQLAREYGVTYAAIKAIVKKGRRQAQITPTVEDRP